MKKYFFLMLLLGFIFISCEDKSTSLLNRPTEQTLEIERLESKYGLSAFKETIELTSDDQNLKITLNLASFNNEKFKLLKSIKFNLKKVISEPNLAFTDVKSQSQPNLDISDMDRLIVEVVNISNPSEMLNYRLEFDTKNIPVSSSKSNLKINNWYNFELVSNSNPNGLYAGRSPFSTGNIYFSLEGKSCWLCGWNGWYANNLPVPSEWNFSFTSYWKGKVLANYDPGAVGYFTFY
jgi:hypothetical protein